MNTNATTYSEERFNLETVQPGDGVTYNIFTDNQAYTVLKKTKTTVTAQRDKATLINGPDSGEDDALKVYPGGFCANVQGKQRHAYEPDPEGGVIKITRRKLPNGQSIWKVAGSGTTSPGGTCWKGRQEYYDYNF